MAAKDSQVSLENKGIEISGTGGKNIRNRREIDV